MEGKFCELRQIGFLGSCASPCNTSYLATLPNTAGLTSPALYVKEAALMRRIMVLLTVVALMLVMLAMTIVPAFAARPSDANRLRACQTPGVLEGHAFPDFCRD
jgi:hypothetical protein